MIGRINVQTVEVARIAGLEWIVGDSEKGASGAVTAIGLLPEENYRYLPISQFSPSGA